MKYRLIQRNDGKYQYEYAFLTHPHDGSDIWDRVEYMTFDNEQTARASIQAIINFARAAEVLRVVEEIEL